MVSKVAVIAIVAILAAPILLGYALNVEQVTETDYKTTGDPVNVTPLLQTGTQYSYANADLYQLNTSFNRGAHTPEVPVFERIGNNKTSYNLLQFIWPPQDLYLTINEWSDKFAQVDVFYTSPGQNEQLRITNTQTTVLSIDNLLFMYYDAAAAKVYYTYYTDNNHTTTNNGVYSVTDTSYGMQINKASGTFDVFVTLGRSSSSTYVDISAGYHFVNDPGFWMINLTQFTKSAIITIDLDSITEDNYTLKIGAGGHNNGSDFNATHPYNLTKTTTAGVVTWTLTSIRDPIRTWDLYYDPAIPHNTYQIYWDWVYDHSGDPYYYVPLEMDFHDMYYNSHREFRYVGNWPDAIGEANNYWKVTDDIEWYVSAPMPYELPDYVPSDYTDYNFSHVYLASTNITPTMRIDAASFRAFEYQVIEDRTYDAAAFKTNPATTINDPTLYGSSFTFGGNTYNVSKGNITMGNHDIPVKGLVLSSVPNPEGGYDNKIGNTVISTTAAPSAITFNGKWSASITTSAQEEYEITKTEWKAGDFAWDGIDHNFIMAGLLASLGAFVGVGIYSRRTKTSLWPLLIVCGGAALLFFVML